MKAIAILLALCGVASAGPTIDLDFREAPVRDVARILADVGRVNIVFIDGVDAKVDVKFKRASWDKVLAEVVVKRARLATVREGNVILVGEPAAIAARKKQKHKRSGKPIDIDFNNVDVAAVGDALAFATQKPIAITGGTKPITLRLRRTPLDQASDILALVSGGTLGTKAVPPWSPGCVAVTADIEALRLGGIVAVGDKRYAVVLDGATAHVVRANDCAGKTQSVVRDVGTSYITFLVGKEERSLQLYPPRTPPE